MFEALDAVASLRLQEESFLKALATQMVYHMADFSSRDVARSATACQRLVLRDGALMEAMLRQALRRGGRMKVSQSEAVLAACAAANFQHPMLVELREGLEMGRWRGLFVRYAAAEAQKVPGE